MPRCPAGSTGALVREQELVAVEGSGEWCHAVPRVLSWRSAVPCRARGAVPVVPCSAQGAVPWHGQPL